MLNRLNAASLTVASLAALSGCDEATSSQPTQVDEEVALDFLVDQGELSILAFYPLEEWIGGASPGERTLRYELRRSGGEAIVSGSIPDPRVRPWRAARPSRPPRASGRCACRPSRASS